MGTNKNLANGIDFPVLVLDNINKAQMTEFINKYICLLTNTTTSSVSGGTYNFADNVTGVYDVVLKRVTFNSAGNAISEISDSDVCLKKVTLSSISKLIIQIQKLQLLSLLLWMFSFMIHHPKMLHIICISRVM